MLASRTNGIPDVLKISDAAQLINLELLGNFAGRLSTSDLGSDYVWQFQPVKLARRNMLFEPG